MTTDNDSVINEQGRKIDKCSALKPCEWLEERIDFGVTGKGFHALYCLDPSCLQEKEARHYLYAVSYSTSKKDKGIILNYCPFCGGRPGELHADKIGLPI